MSKPIVSLREVGKPNLRQVLMLEVAPGQRHLVASNAKSIAQAYFDRERAWFRAIYADDEPVGFLMLMDDPEKPEYFLWRFMIGAAFQGRGFGSDAIRLLADHVRTRPRARELLLSHDPGEGNPGPFYEGLGFTYTGDADPDGELIMKLVL